MKKFFLFFTLFTIGTTLTAQIKVTSTGNVGIQCYIPPTIKKVELCIYNMQGAQIKCITVSERGIVSVQIQAGHLAAGVYTYLLIGDGRASDAKQMILTK